ncbi:MAG: hypothetical protein ACD_18C00021G0001 [uncultured bacterium]|nr:MAG: hypothetical protein ACD_18C00021G0001 [uncultured bacterium]
MHKYSLVYTAPSIAVAKYMTSVYKINFDKIKVIFHGVETARFANIKLAKLLSPYKLLIVGRLAQAKGHKVALEALSKIKNVEVKLKIVGSGELKQELIEQVQKNNIAEKIEWQDADRNVEKFYEEADLILVPSIVEGFGLVALEAMASGRAVIASDVDGLAEIIKDGETGFLFLVGDSDKLAEKIENIFSDKEKLQGVALEARKWVLENAKVEDMALKYENIYLSLSSSKVDKLKTKIL